MNMEEGTVAPTMQVLDCLRCNKPDVLDSGGSSQALAMAG